MYHSYAMGLNEDILKLKSFGFIIEKDDEDYMVSFPKGKENVWEDYIIKNLNNGYWNEYIGENIVFLFKFDDGHVKKYILNDKNENEILNLCCKFAETEFNSIKEMLLDNDFYKSKIIN